MNCLLTTEYPSMIRLYEGQLKKGGRSARVGAKEIHIRISSPPTAHSCFYGVDTPEVEKLLAHDYTIEKMRKFIGAASVAFISLDGLYRAMGETKRNNAMPQFCDACFSGDYPISLTDLNSPTPVTDLSLLARGNR